MRFGLCRFALAVTCAALAITAIPSGGQARRPATRTPSKATATSAERPRFKAIFEPVNFNGDVKLFSTWFADDKNGWIAGGTSEMKGGMIAHTTDGGEHWAVVAGDVQSADRAFAGLRFLDASHGWAVQPTGQAAQLFATQDGEHWLPVGTIQEHFVDYWFTTPSSGIEAHADTIQRTVDGGKSWQTAGQCATTTQVNGLARNVRCQIKSMSFPSASVGYAAGMASGVEDQLFLMKTADGGASWQVSTIPVPNLHPGPEDLHFLDERVGFMRVGAHDTGKLYKTTDGGLTWQAVAASPGFHMEFAKGGRAGWAFHYEKMGFTSDGERWNSRVEQFPAEPLASSLPLPNHGWVAGEHGMVYRYRIVPIDYQSKGMMDAPALGASPAE